MFNRNQLDEGTEETFREFFYVDMEGFAEAQFHKLTSNYFIDCVCRHCGEYIKYITLRALLIHAIGCSKQILQMQSSKNTDIEKVETIEIPFMKCGVSITQQDKNILSALAQIKSIILDKDEETEDEEIEKNYNNSKDTKVKNKNILQQNKKKQSMGIEQVSQDDILQQIVKASEYQCQDNTNRFIAYIHEGKSSRSQTYDKLIKNNQNLKSLIERYWEMNGISDPRIKFAKKRILNAMHRPDLYYNIRFLEIRNLKLQQPYFKYFFFSKLFIKFNFYFQSATHKLTKASLSKNAFENQKYTGRRKSHQSIKQYKKNKQRNMRKSNLNQYIQIFFYRIAVFTQILVLFFTGADINDLPHLKIEMLNQNLYQYTTTRTNKVRHFKLHPEDNEKLQELVRRLQNKKQVSYLKDLTFGDKPEMIKQQFYQEIESGPNPQLTLQDIKATRACEILNYEGKECITAEQVKDFLGQNNLCTTMKYLAQYDKIYRVNSQPFSCPSLGRFINQQQ